MPNSQIISPCEWAVLPGSLLATLINSAMSMSPSEGVCSRYVLHGRQQSKTVAKDDADYQAAYIVLSSIGVLGGKSTAGAPLGMVVCRASLGECKEPTPEDIRHAQEAYPSGCYLLFVSHSPPQSSADTSTLHIHYSMYYIVPQSGPPSNPNAPLTAAWEVPLIIDSLQDSAYKAMQRTVEVFTDYGAHTTKPVSATNRDAVPRGPLSADCKALLDVHARKEELLQQIRAAHEDIHAALRTPASSSS